MKLSSDQVYKYVGLSVMVVVFIYIVATSLKFQSNLLGGLLKNGTIREGLTSATVDRNVDRSTVSGTVVSNTNLEDDTLVVSKYRKNYEDIILDLDTNAKIFVLSKILNNAEKISADPTSPEAQTTIVAVNNLVAFRNSLDKAMGFLKEHP